MVVFASASESHNAKNLNRSIDGSLAAFAEVAALGRQAGVPVHGAIATAFGCPFEGEVPVAGVVRVARAYADLGIRRIALGDTTGMATPPLVRQRVEALRSALPDVEIALHFHNTRGIGLANVMEGAGAGRGPVRELDRRSRRLPVRAGGDRQHRDRGSGLSAGGMRLRHRGRPSTG